MSWVESVTQSSTVTSDTSIGDITDADAEAYYAENKAEFVRPERRRCAPRTYVD